MVDEKRVYPAKRPIRKVLITIPKDQIDMIDECAKAIGMSRSAFLQVYFDTFAERIRDFTEGWLVGIRHYYQKQMQELKKS
jgi:hypothetical protein